MFCLFFSLTQESSVEEVYDYLQVKFPAAAAILRGMIIGMHLQKSFNSIMDALTQAS